MSNFIRPISLKQQISMIKPKEKPCKGTTAATKNLGCGKLTFHRVHGLGKSCCYPKWLLETEAGQIKFAKALLKASKPRLDLEQAERQHKEKKGIAGALLITKTVVHAYVRQRDKGKPCVSCGCNWNNEFEAGHHYSANSFLTLKFDLDNINGQCFHCNNRLGGNFDNYALRLPERIGIERYNNLVAKAQIDKQFSKVWNLENLKEIRDNIKKLKTLSD